MGMPISAMTWMRSGALALAALVTVAADGAAQGYPPGWNTVLDESVLTYITDPDDQLGPIVGCFLLGTGVSVTHWTHRRPTGNPAPAPEAGDEDGWPVRLTLVSGSVRETVTAWGVPLRDGTTEVRTHFPSNHPLVAAFAATGELTLTALGETRTTTRAPLAMVRRMVAECRERPRRSR